MSVIFKYKRVKKRLEVRFRNLVIKIIYSVIRIDKKTVVFDQFNGRGIGCNPGYIAMKLSAKYPNFKIIWLLSKKNTQENHGWLTYADTTFLGKCFAMASAKTVVFNTVNAMSDWPKKKGQIWIQTGHGSFGIKKIGLDVDNKRKKKIKKESKKTNFLLSNSTFESGVFSTGFMYRPKQILEVGHARNDVFFDDAQASKIDFAVRNKYDLLGKKLILFAPTHGKNEMHFLQSIDVNGILKALHDKFDGNWFFGLRLHPRTSNRVIRERIPLSNMQGANVIDLSGHSDMQELLVTADSMITDYSSGIFDFLLTKRPSFFHLDECMKDDLIGGIYFNFDDTPVPVSYESSALINNILNYDVSYFKEGVDDFMNSAGSFEHGNGASHAADIIKLASEGISVSVISELYDRSKNEESEITTRNIFQVARDYSS